MEVRRSQPPRCSKAKKEEGVKLVMASCCDAAMRAPYQGKASAASDGSSGKTADGKIYTPLDEALQGEVMGISTVITGR